MAIDANALRWISSRVDEMESQLLPAYSDDEETRDILRACFTAGAYIDAFIRTKIVGLRKLVDPFELRADWLEFLGGVVGFSPDTGIPGHLDAATWRRLIPGAAAIWSEKGLTYRHMITALTGRRCWISGWHDVRHILDETPLPHLGIASSAAGTHAERTTLVHLEDPIATFPSYTPAEGEVAVNRSLLQIGLDIIRPIQQRIDVSFYDVVEDNSGGLSRWEKVAGSDPSVDPVTELLTVPESSTIAHDPGDVADEMRFGVWEVYLRCTGANSRFSVRLRDEGTEAVSIGLWLKDDPTLSAWTIGTTTAGTIASGTVSLAKGEFFWLNVTIDQEGANERVALYVEGEKLGDATFAAEPATVGPTSFLTIADTELEVQLLEQWQVPATTIRIGPNP